MSRREPITRIGWREAVKMIRDEGWELSVNPDGHAELLSPPVHVQGGHHADSVQQKCAYHYLTCRSVELVKNALGR